MPPKKRGGEISIWEVGGKSGGGGGAWWRGRREGCLVEKNSCEPRLETVQGLGCYHILRKMIPFWNCPGEECLLTVESSAYRDIVALEA